MQIAEQLYAAGIAVFPCRDNKRPAVNKGESWKDYAAQPPSNHQWVSPLVGVPIPDGCVVIDLDTYKGVTRQSVETILGCALPWDAALIQLTKHGGQHYAFSVNWNVRQGSDIQIEGLDTRVAGKGYICTGAPYYQPQGFGIFALAYPDSLPMMPDECRAVLEHVKAEAPTVPDLPTGDKDIENITAALRFIDPGCTRTEWVKVGLALRHYFHDDEAGGYAMFDRWSAGELWPDGAPANYNAEDMVHQWTSFKPEGGVAIGSLFYEAIRGGWIPPATLDTSLAFGVDAAPTSDFNDVLSMIHESGTDSTCVPEIIGKIRSTGFNELQAGLLRGELKAALRSVKLLDKNLTAEIDRQIGGVQMISGDYDKNHAANASLFIDTNFPNDTLLRNDEIWYVYDGRSWVEKEDAAIRHQLVMAMIRSYPQSGTVTGTYQMLCDLTYRPNIKMNSNDNQAILFQNGVLDLTTGQMGPHSPAYYTTKILPYNLDQYATAPQWVEFMDQVFEGDQERIELLQEWLGYMMSPTYRFQKIMLLLGPRRAGKSLIGTIMKSLVGELNFTGLSLESLTDDDAMDHLRSKTVAFSGETPLNINRNKVESVIERIKKISGGDPIDFKRKYKSRMSCTMPTRITLSSNHVPRLFDDSGALSFRMIVLPFEVSFANREDVHLPGKLQNEIEGIAVWALQGLARLNARCKFHIPEKSRAEMAAIDEAYSPLMMFIAEYCELGGENVTKVLDLYNAYRAWALEEQQRSIMGRNTFVNAFKDTVRGKDCRYGIHRTGDKVDRGFKGLKIGVPEGAHASAFKPELVK